MSDYPSLLEKLGPDGLDELRRLIAEEVSRRGRPEAPPPRRRDVPGQDEDIRPRS